MKEGGEGVVYKYQTTKTSTKLISCLTQAYSCSNRNRYRVLKEWSVDNSQENKLNNENWKSKQKITCRAWWNTAWGFTEKNRRRASYWLIVLPIMSSSWQIVSKWMVWQLCANVEHQLVQITPWHTKQEILKSVCHEFTCDSHGKEQLFRSHSGCAERCLTGCYYHRLLDLRDKEL